MMIEDKLMEIEEVLEMRSLGKFFKAEKLLREVHRYYRHRFQGDIVEMRKYRRLKALLRDFRRYYARGYPVKSLVDLLESEFREYINYVKGKL